MPEDYHFIKGILDPKRLPCMCEQEKGAVPPTSRPTGKFLRDDGKWAIPTKLSISDVDGLQAALDAKLNITQFSGLTKITVGTTPPENPAIGDIWIDTTQPE